MESVAGSLQNDWAIITALLILAILQGYKIWLDNRLHRSRKERENRMEQVMINIEIYLKTLSNKYTEEVTDIQMPIIVNEFVGHMESQVLCEGAASITRNDVKNNREDIEAKITSFIVNRHRELVINLGRFKWRGAYLSEYLPQEDRGDLIDDVLDVILKERDTKEQVFVAYRNLGSVVKTHCDEVRQSVISKAYG
jgi:hypothetical protein